MVAPHWSQVSSGQMIEGQVNGATATVARSSCDVPPFEHLGSVDIGIVSWLRPAVLRLLRPANEAIHGTLRTIPIPEKQAKAKGCGPLPRSLQRSAQSPRANDSIRLVSVHRLAGKVVPRGVLGVPAYSGHELVYKDEILLHRPQPLNVDDTNRSITSVSGN